MPLRPNKYLLILLATITAYMLFEYYRPKPIDWNDTYENDDKIPFGAKVVYDLLPDLTQQADVKTIRVPLYNFFTESKPQEPGNYVAICRDFYIDDNDLDKLLRYVQRGNNAFISAYNLSDTLGSVLGFNADVKAIKLRDTTLLQNFSNPQLRSRSGYNFLHDDGRNFLEITKKKNITVLGRNARKEPVFIQVQYGKGNFFIHNLPIAFTNYYVLDAKTSDYWFKALSYLPARPTYWDEYQKQGRFDEDQQSIFRYIRSQPALNWAYYLVVFGLIFYAIFAGKRTQRIIPVQDPLRNTSLDFVKNVGRLYFQQGDHDNLARKKIQFFLAEIRDQYGLNTTVLDKEFTETLTRKSGTPPNETRELVQLLRDAQKSISLSEFDLLALNGAIERFKTGI